MTRRPARLSALHRGGFFRPGAVLPGPDGEHSLALIPQAFASVRPALVQPIEGQTLVVGSDGCPGRPGLVLARHERRRRIPSR
jgi:hypothetical protein